MLYRVLVFLENGGRSGWTAFSGEKMITFFIDPPLKGVIGMPAESRVTLLWSLAWAQSGMVFKR